MSYYDTINKLYDMAENQKMYNFAHCHNIINAIMSYYMVSADFYFEDCITVFDGFLKTGILSFPARD